MGRLFWKFFLFIWLAQLAGILGTGALFWLERESHDRGAHGGEPAAHVEHGPPPGFDGPGHGPHGHRPPPLGIPLAPVAAGLLASLVCAAGLAWYIARPVRRLRRAFEAAAEGQLDQHLARDMGGRRDELADLGDDFDRMAARLQALMHSQTRLLHDVSHELRSPLARLQAAIGLVRQQPERCGDYLPRIEREGERMNRLVGELLTLSRFEAGVGGTLEVVDLPELLGDLVEDARFEAAARNIAVDLPEMPKTAVRANPEMLHRAIDNVLRNALRHSPAGGRIAVTLERLPGERCRIAVRDHGPGVPADQLERIFMPFFRNDERREGYGLGLAIARRALAIIGGSIVAGNCDDGGLRVTIDLPLLDGA